MAEYGPQARIITKRLLDARLRLLEHQAFYALLLLNMKFALDSTCDSVYTDGTRIAFNPDYINHLSDEELEFVLMHAMLHVVLGHPFRSNEGYDPELYDRACDIVVNSNILYSFGMNKQKITLKNYGEAMHLTPNGDEGFLYTVEEVYGMLCDAENKPRKKKKGEKSQEKKNGEDTDSGESGQEGESDQETDDRSDEEKADGGDSGEGESKGKSKGKGKGKDKGEGKGQGKGEAEPNRDDPSEEDMKALITSMLQRKKEQSDGGFAEGLKKEDPLTDCESAEMLQESTLDDHTFWEGEDEDGQQDVWLQRMLSADDVVSSMGGKSRGTEPLAVQRLLKEMKSPLLDWRTILHDFVQEEICDYSFSPPDKRMEDCPFFLPDFNEKDDGVKNILFMIDTSGSMGDYEITRCYSEIHGAIDQFNGRLQGKLGFFDATVVEPIPFEDESEFKIIRPIGGGGTSFHIIFDYVKNYMKDDLPVSIVILTDGFAPWPEESAAMEIPVLWIINNEVAQPPWGKVARLMETK